MTYMAVRRWRRDARALERAVRVFERREWKDGSGSTIAGDALAHLRYRARAIRLEKGAYH